jgi:chorismate mutase/prephenate dehydratase
MTRRGETQPSAAEPDTQLKVLRAQIDKLDLQILELLNKRASIATQIGKLKQDQGGEVFSAAREEEVLANVLAAHKGPLPEVTIKAIFRELISGSRAVQKVTRIAFFRSGVQL